MMVKAGRSHGLASAPSTSRPSAVRGNGNSATDRHSLATSMRPGSRSA